MRFPKILSSFLKDRGGASALEFAIIVPVLAAAVVGGLDAWRLINTKQDMHAAVAAGAHYYMGGGTDDATGRTVSLQGWSNAPADARITISRACACAGVAGDCNTVCAATQQAPEARVTITAQAQWNGLQPTALSESETVRVR